MGSESSGVPTTLVLIHSSLGLNHGAERPKSYSGC